MKYRIKDEKKRRAVLEIFGNLAGAIPAKDGALAQLSLDVPGVLISPLTAELELEQIPDNKAWTLYNEGTTLEPFAPFFVVKQYRDRDRDESVTDTRLTYSDKNGRLPDDVIAFIPLPRWKE